MSADLYRRPSWEEIAERVAMALVPEVPAIVAEPAISVPEPPPAAPARSADCERCGYRRNMLGHVWVCVAPGGRWKA